MSRGHAGMNVPSLHDREDAQVKVKFKLLEELKHARVRMHGEEEV